MSMHPEEDMAFINWASDNELDHMVEYMAAHAEQTFINWVMDTMNCEAEPRDYNDPDLLRSFFNENPAIDMHFNKWTLERWTQRSPC